MQFHGLDETTNNTAADKIPLQLVADSGARIILFFGDLGELLHVLPLANQVGLIGPEYVWIASEAVAGIAEEARLDPALQRLVNGLMHTFPVEYANERDSRSLLKRVQLTSPDFERLQPYGGFHRDCLFSLTVNFIEQLRSGVPESLVLSRANKVPISSFVKPFDGISGPVNFDSNENRVGTFTMFSLFEGKETPVYEVDPSGRVKQLAEPRFFSGTTSRPSDLPDSLVGFLRFQSPGTILIMAANTVGTLCIAVTMGSLFFVGRRQSSKKPTWRCFRLSESACLW
ncbi:hypothetical protein BCR44DRAFT_1006359 [Catenaria anguillulae PL171]|uniref:Receptor ligand binding region domain-containing protein n=1 Tax=Catenaria anguillulae PL171 TaxID=765915 RepID=A0A1Y2I3H6_9FUNG|nr:hypothetical protein BCR44DRAFT_1006359 [Catenaria anguillulae PL171]